MSTPSTSPTLAEHLADRPFTLAMSSGFFGFFAHAGMLSALVEYGLQPARVVGSSAGALVGGAYAAGISQQELRELLFGLSRRDFWDPRPGIGLLAGRRMDKLMRDALPAQHFGELAIPFACSAWRIRTLSTEVLDEGDLICALRASAAFPLLFQPVRVLGNHYLDGGIADRPAFAPLEDGEFTLYHHLESRSPWRGGPSSTTNPPTRPNTLTIDLGRLPRLGPFALDDGPRAWEIARERMTRRLDEPLS